MSRSTDTTHIAKRCSIFLAMLFLVAGVIHAQKVRIYATADEITTDDQYQIKVEISDYRGQVGYPQFPPISGFHAAGTSTQQNFINGRMTIAFARTYWPKKPGNFKVPAFSYKLNGKTFKSPPMSVKVKKGTGRRQQQQTQRNPFDDFFKSPFDDFFGGGRRKQQQPKDLKFEKAEADYFLSVNLDADSCYVGEQVRGEVVLYIAERDVRKIRVDGASIVEMQQRIKNTGFWQEIIDFKQVPQNRVHLNGKNYVAYTLYRTVLFPIKTGEIAFNDVYLDAKRMYVATNASIFDAFLGKNARYEPLKIRAGARSLYVKPLPRTDLPNASMVGKFKMNAELNTVAIETGGNLELAVNIKGNGNIAMMPEPVLNFPASFNHDAPNIEFNSRKSETSYYGDKDFKYYIVPTKGGDYDLGPLKFYYFNPKDERYDSLVVASLPVRVTGEDLENLVLQKTGLDSFYETALSDADAGLRKKGNMGGIAFLGALLLLAGAVTYRVVRQRKLPVDVGEESGDFWTS